MNHILLYYLISLPISLFVILITKKIIKEEWDEFFMATCAIFWPVSLFIGLLMLIIYLFQFIIDLFLD